MADYENDSKDGIVESLVNVNRVTKVTKGGRRFAFSACVVVGNKKGMVGYGHGKAKEVTEARTKATQAAKKNMIKIPLYQSRTIHYDVIGQKGAAKVILRKASPGKGVIAGGAIRSVFELAGVHDIVAKSIKSGGVYNMLAATFNAFSKLNQPSQIAKRRGKSLETLSTRTSLVVKKKVSD
jgi:small subunit ribosomal protein S5